MAQVIGTEVLRKEDPELITGQAKYIDDLVVPGMVWMHVVRSPLAHAKINGIDISRAKEMPGVIAAFSGADLADDWPGPLLMAWPVTEDIHNPPHWPLTKDKARYQGDGVAVVIAETRAQAADAAEAVDVDYEPLDPVVDMEAALADGAPAVHDEFGTNKCYVWAHTNGEVDSVFDSAPVIVKERYVIQRQVPNAMEGRGVLCQPNPAMGDFTLYSSTQIPHIVKVGMALGTGIPESKIRVVAPRVGGGFGSKLQVYPEEQLALTLAKRLGLPIKWIETRSENFLATHHGRDQIQEMELAAGADGKIRGFRAKIKVNMGAYLMIITPGTPLLGAWVYSGCYGGEAYGIEFTGVFTNTTPTDAYRGAGRPEATYAIERIMDALAKKVGKDPVEIRRMNFMPASTEPFAMPGGLTIDSANYDSTLDTALGMVGYDACWPSRRPGGTVATPRCWGSGSRPTSRCAASPRPGSCPCSGMRPADGTRPSSGCCRPARSCSPSARRRTARGTRPRSARSWRTTSASRWRTSRSCTPTRSSHRSAWTRTVRGRSRSAA